MIIYKVHTDKDIWDILLQYTISLRNPFIHYHDTVDSYWFIKNNIYCTTNWYTQVRVSTSGNLPTHRFKSIEIDDVYYEHFIQSMFYVSQPQYDIEEKQKLKHYIENLSTYLYSINL